MALHRDEAESWHDSEASWNYRCGPCVNANDAVGTRGIFQSFAPQPLEMIGGGTPNCEYECERFWETRASWRRELCRHCCPNRCGISTLDGRAYATASASNRSCCRKQRVDLSCAR